MHRVLRATKGASLVEYGILVGLIAVLGIGSVLRLGEENRTVFNVATANLGWNLDGITENFGARYRFTPAQSPANASKIGFDIDGLSGAPYGSVDEATFDDFDVRSIQYNLSNGIFSVVMGGNTETATLGHELSCLDLSTGETEVTMDFDVVSGSYNDIYEATSYSSNVGPDLFEIDQELACVIDEK